MKLNHMICPTCDHDFYTDCSYATCDACQRFFYASESKTSQTKLPVTEQIMVDLLEDSLYRK